MPLPPHNGRRRAVIEDVYPQVDSGRHPICRDVGDEGVVTAAIFADGKDEGAARLLFRHSDDHRWSFASMHATGNDLWSGSFRVDKLGYWRYSLLAWIDHFATWTSQLKKRIAAQKDPVSAEIPSNSVAGLIVGSKFVEQDVALALRFGAELIQAAAQRTHGNDAKSLREIAERFEKLAAENRENYDDPCDEELLRLMRNYPDLANGDQYTRCELNYVALRPGIQPAHNFRVS